MKKTILLIISLLFTLFIYQNNLVFADTGDKINMVLTEKVPGANCSPKKSGDLTVYECSIEKGTGAAIKMLGEILKYFVYLASLIGVAFIVYNGILYSMSGVDDSLKADAKKRIVLTLTGLALLFLSGPILKIIAPWIYQ